LGTVRVSSLDAHDHIDFLMALGEALFFEDDYGAAAQLFESGLDGAIAQGPVPAAEAMLDWWSSAMERHADGQVATNARPRSAACSVIACARGRANPTSITPGQRRHARGISGAPAHASIRAPGAS